MATVGSKWHRLPNNSKMVLDDAFSEIYDFIKETGDWKIKERPEDISNKDSSHLRKDASEVHLADDNYLDNIIKEFVKAKLEIPSNDEINYKEAKKIMEEKGIFNHLKDVSRRLYQEAIEVIELECQKVMEEALSEVMNIANKTKMRAVDDVLKEIASKHNNFINQLYKQHEKELQEEIAKVEIRTRQHLDTRMEEERRSSERRMKLAMEEAQKHFRDHLKMAVQETQAQERRLANETYAKMKRDFEEKLRKLNRAVNEDKQRSLTQLQRQLESETENTIHLCRQEGEMRLKAQLQQQKEKYENIIHKLESRLKEMNKQVQELVQQLRETLLKKSEAEDEISKIRTQLSQFIKLASKTESISKPH